jgi:hypothetical protein
LNQKSYTFTQRGTALATAASGKSLEIVAALLAAKADPNLYYPKVSLANQLVSHSSMIQMVAQACQDCSDSSGVSFRLMQS